MIDALPGKAPSNGTVAEETPSTQTVSTRLMGAGDIPPLMNEATSPWGVRSPGSDCAVARIEEEAK